MIWLGLLQLPRNVVALPADADAALPLGPSE
jgi:hypothetical protein